MNLKRV